MHWGFYFLPIDFYNFLGPLTFDYATFNGSLPTLVTNPYAWTEVQNFSPTSSSSCERWKCKDFFSLFRFIDTILWTTFQVANIIFLDAPVGTGFSYSESLEGYYSSDTKSPYDTYIFLRKVGKNCMNMSNASSMYFFADFKNLRRQI